MSHSTDVAVSRGMLRLLREDMKRLKTKRPKKYWTYDDGSGRWEFQAPDDDFYWYGSASCAFEARYKGINAWLQKFDPEGYARMEAAAVTTRKG